VPESGLKGVNWRLLLNTFFWNINYWESASCFAAEVSVDAMRCDAMRCDAMRCDAMRSSR
jgi:hypothetical protein